MPPFRCIAALDQGTSSTRCILFDHAGDILTIAQRPHVNHYPQPGWVEHDAEEIWQNTLAVLRTVLVRQAAVHGEIQSLSVTNQRETIVVFDRTTGAPLAPAIVWQCRRGDPYCAEHRAAGREPLAQRKTGLKLDAYFSGSKLQWLAHQRPELCARLADGTAVLGTIDAYLVHRLTGGRVFATDNTNASRTLLYDIGRLQWDDELCALWQVPRHALPEVRESGADFGATTLDGLLPRALPIRGVMGDSQASLFAQRCFQPGAAKVTFGTGSSLLLNVGPEFRQASCGVLTTLGWVHRGVPTYAFEGIIISAASTLTWLCDQLGVASDVPALERLALSVPDNGGVVLVPAFSGLGLPHWRPDSRAAVVGLSSQSDRRHVARAAFESIGFQVRDALDAMRAEARLPLASLHADGGPTTSKYLMQFCADLCGVALHVATMPDCSALGAVLAGRLGSGSIDSVESLAKVPRDETVFTPSLPSERVAALHAGWQGALQQALKI